MRWPVWLLRFGDYLWLVFSREDELCQAETENRICNRPWGHGARHIFDPNWTAEDIA